MKFGREVVTDCLTREQMLEELSAFVAYFTERGVETCDVLFGWHWGIKYYPGKEWPTENVALSRLLAKVGEVEELGIGRLGDDDLYLKLPDLEFQFSHHSDVHIFFDSTSEDVEFFYSRWKQLGYNPAEWLKSLEGGPGTRVRMN